LDFISLQMEGKGYEDPNRLDLIEYLRREGRGQPLWICLAEDLGKSRKNRAQVNLEKINRLTRPRDTVVVAGKVLGDGILDHEVTIACFRISEQARKKVEQANGSIITIKDLLEKNPKGTKVKILR